LDCLKVDIDLYETSVLDAFRQCVKALKYPSSYFHLTAHGVHIIIPELPNDYNLRLYFMDDYNRIQMDMIRERRNYPVNVLFIAKNGRLVTVTKNIEEVYRWLRDVKKSLK